LKAIASYGIKEIAYAQTYELDESTLELAEEFGIKLIQLNT
jgi:deoxycytidylate deaminase